jgi:NTE family protein
MTPLDVHDPATGGLDRRRQALGELPGRRVGLVLGAGGATGMAFHAGTLLALTNDFGWDPRQATAIVGTSAGSVVGTLLRSGLSTDDLASWSASVAPAPGGEAFRALLDEAEAERPTLVRPRWRRPRLGDPRLRRALISSLPNGFVDASSSLAKLASLTEGWPEQALWINAVRRRDLRRVVFGRDFTPDLGDAVAASCSIPGLFTPVRIGGESYVDGGVHSPTNADVLHGTDVDTVVVLSPMSVRPRAVRSTADHAMRLAHARRLRRECRRLRRSGIDVHIFEPDDATLRAMGRNALDRSRSGGVVRESFLAAVS